MPTYGDPLTSESGQAQLRSTVQAAIHTVSQLQRDRDWGSDEAARLAEAGYALQRAAVALSEIP